MKRSIFGAVVAVLQTVAVPASAMPAPPAPGVIAVPTSTAKTLELLDARLRFECDGGHPLECMFVATYRVRNGGATEVRQAIAAPTPHEAAEITLDGQPVSGDVTVDEKRAIDELAGARPRGTELRSFIIAAAPGATRTLVVRGRTKVSSHLYFAMLVFPANSARHVVLANHQPDQAYRLRYALAGVRTWSGAPRVELELVVPTRLGVDGPPLAAASGSTLYRAVVSEAQPADEVNVEVYLPPPAIYPGGVLAGIGGSTGDEKGLRLRVGGELAVQTWLFGSVVYETNARGRNYLVPAVHAALPMLAIIPSLGAGLGVPVQVSPTTRVGMRLQLDAHLASLGFLTTIDWYPKTDNEPALVQPSFLFQLAL